MRYILNLSIVFVPDNRTLSLVHDEDSSVSLSAPACRLLSVLIQQNGSTVSRAWLLKTVWEDYGFIGSNSNLNNYIGEIRRSIHSLDPQLDIITTIPKVGIQIDANISPLPRENINIENNINGYNNQLDQTILPEESSSVTLKNNILGDKNKVIQKNMNDSKTIKSTSYLIIAIAIAIAIAITATAFTFASRENEKSIKIKKEKYSLIAKENNCDIYYLDQFLTPDHKSIMGDIKNQLTNTNINCNSEYKKDVYFYSTPDKGKTSLFTFIAECVRKKEDNYNYSSCSTKVKVKGVDEKNENI